MLPWGVVERPEVIVLELGPVVGVDALVDDLDGALLRGGPAEVGQPLLGHDHVHVVLAVVDVGHHRDNAGDVSPGRHRGGGEDRDERVPGKIAGAADPVDDPRAVDVGRVDVAVEVELHAPVHREDAEPLDDPDVVADRLRPQEDLVLVRVDVRLEFLDHGRRHGERRRRSERDLPRVDQGQHPVLDDLGVDGQVLELRVQQPVQDGVGHIAHARLQREQVLGQPPFLHLVPEELEDMPGDRPAVRVRLLEHRGPVGMVRLDDRLDLLRGAGEVGRPDAVGGFQDHDRLHLRRQGRLVDVVHPLQLQRMVVVDFEDHFPRGVDEDLVVSHRGGGNELPVLGDAGHLDDRGVEVPEETAGHVLRDRPEVKVEIFHLPEVDLLAGDRVGVVRHAQLDAVHHRQRPVELAARRGSRHDGDAELPALAVLPQDMLGERLRDQLRIAGPREPAHPHLVAASDQLRRVRRVGDLRLQLPVFYPLSSHHDGASLHAGAPFTDVRTRSRHTAGGRFPSGEPPRDDLRNRLSDGRDDFLPFLRGEVAPADPQLDSRAELDAFPSVGFHPVKNGLEVVLGAPRDHRADLPQGRSRDCSALTTSTWRRWRYP